MAARKRSPKTIMDLFTLPYYGARGNYFCRMQGRKDYCRHAEPTREKMLEHLKTAHGWIPEAKRKNKTEKTRLSLVPFDDVEKHFS